MADFPECSRRGKIVNKNFCECFTNRIVHPREGYASLETCKICPYKNMEDDPDLPNYAEQRHPDSQQELPQKGTMALNFIKAVSRHIVDGGRKVSKKIFKKRLEECDKCVFHKKNRCSHMQCGCVLTKKARWKSEDCPIGRWPK
tara:strand:- start:197 stop:628 length:432 start_codon:yes stop_codon:yes gene_type:complete